MLVAGIIRGLPRPKFHIILCPIPAPRRPPSVDTLKSADSVVHLTLSYVTNVQIMASVAADVIVYLDITSEPMTHFLGHARLAPVQALFWGKSLLHGYHVFTVYMSCVKQLLGGRMYSTRTTNKMSDNIASTYSLQCAIYVYEPHGG